MAAVCDRCGSDCTELRARVDIEWWFMHEDKTVFGGVLNPSHVKRTLCIPCFSKMAESTATDLTKEE